MNPRQLIGRQLADKYTLESLLGVGGFGAVYRARQAPIDRLVAVKVNLHPHRVDLQARFVREARLQAELRHPGCVMLLDCGETEGLFYLVQEFVDGRSLKAELGEGALAPERAVELICQVLGALSEAHRHHIVHRDIKPANIMLTRGLGGREEVRVLDFGIAKLLVDNEEDTESLTGTGMSLGTPAYMAPEQIRPGPIGPPTDVYAVGAMLYRVLAGRAAFGGATIDVLTQQLNKPPPPLPDGLSMFDPIVARAMAKRPEDRFQTAAEMSAALRVLPVDGSGFVPRPPPVPGGPTDGADQTLVTPPMMGSMPATPEPSASPVPVTDLRPSPQPARARRGSGLLAILALVVLGAGIGLWIALPGDVDPEPAPDAAVDALVLAGPFDAAAPDSPPDAALPDARPVDAALDARPVDAARRPIRRPKPIPPRGPSASTLIRRFETQLDACRCADARQTLAALRAKVGDRARKLASKHEAACVLFIPGNCQSR